MLDKSARCAKLLLDELDKLEVKLVLKLSKIQCCLIALVLCGCQQKPSPQEIFVNHVNSSIEEINACVNKFDYESALNKTSALLSEVNNDNSCNITTYNELCAKVKSLHAEISNQKYDFDKKIKSGWVIINDKLVSPEQQKMEKEKERKRIEEEKIEQDRLKQIEQERKEQERKLLEEKWKQAQSKLEAERIHRSIEQARKAYPKYKAEFAVASDAIFRVLKAIEVGTNYTDYVRMMQYINYEVSKFMKRDNEAETLYASYQNLYLASLNLLAAESEWKLQMESENSKANDEQIQTYWQNAQKYYDLAIENINKNS